MSIHSPIVVRAKTAINLRDGPRRSRSFVLQPEVGRSVSTEIRAGWHDAPYPRNHRGRLGEIRDFLAAVYHEIPILAPLATRLMRLLGLGIKAYSMLFRLVVFALAMSPALIKAGVWWWNSRTISRGIKYAANPRNYLDIYHASADGTGTPVTMDNDTAKYPVVVYVTGGAWIIGYKAWAAPLGEYLSKHGVVMVSVDYRNFPQGTLQDMCQDVSAALEWVWKNIDQFGGDRDNITVVGQSAGAHIVSNILLKKAAAESSLSPVGSMPLTAWKRFIGVSGPYDIVSLAPRFNTRGLYSTILNTIMDNDLFGSSPARILSFIKPDNVAKIPPVLLLHGTRDTTVPHISSVEFQNSLKQAGLKEVDLELWPGVTHSEPIVEGPAGGRNFFGARILMAVHQDKEDCNPNNNSEPLINERIISFAKFVMPF